MAPAFTKKLTLKTSTPLRTSDRRKLRNRVIKCYDLTDPEIGELLVPEGLLSVKFMTHSDDPGIAYLSPDGDPLWFSLGKSSEEDLIPTLYTLWKQPTLLPSLSTPSQVIPVLIGGADLMIPGVVTHADSLQKDQLVCITEYEPAKVGPPLAVGRMALDSAMMREDQKGKAVHVIHTWKDHLWNEGSKCDPPTAVSLEDIAQASETAPIEDEAPPSSPRSEISEEHEAQEDSYSPQEVSTILRTAVVQSISRTLSKLPPAAFPISATMFYTSHILPSRPAAPTLNSPVDIKHSTHKSLTAFLKVCDKEGLLKVKDLKIAGKSELAVISVSSEHVDVVTHRKYTTLGDAEAKREEKEERREKERNKVKEMVVTEMYKPHQMSVKFFTNTGNDPTDLYMIASIKSILNKYITENDCINPQEPSYINMDPLLSTVLKANEAAEFMKRDALIAKVVERMQPWYEIQIDGKDTVLKKGQLKPIAVVVKIRQGRKASTLITNFEPFELTAEFLSEELRRICASATSVSQLVGKTSGMEVLVQGKQLKAVTDLLLSKGVPKKWIEAVDATSKKK